MEPRESMPYDVVIVGAGPAGLAAACKIKQLNPETSVCILEKGSEVGAHIISGAVIEPTALQELFPNWKELGAPLNTPVVQDEVYWLNKSSGRRFPSWLVPYTMHNHGNFIISLANLCRWLAEQAESLGVDIFPGFAATEILFNDDNRVCGVATGDMGLDKSANPKPSFTRGMEILAKFTLLAEGCRGHLGKQIISHYKLDQDKDPQHYGLGIKEIWKISKEAHSPGLVVHTAGWPLSENHATGGGFLYHLEDQQVAVGLITDLGYKNPHLSPYHEFQRFKHHPLISRVLATGERTAYGARAIAKGGSQSLPNMEFPGGLLLGDDAGTLNFAKIKGTHTAMKSGMVAAEAVHEALQTSAENATTAFDARYQKCWAWQELYRSRNFAPAIHKWGNFWGGVYGYLDTHLLKGSIPWTMKDPVPDHASLQDVSSATSIHYPKPDGKLSFDRLASVFLSNTNHEEDQPCHLQLADPTIPLASNLSKYNEPAQRYCPAGVYEVIEVDGNKQFQINAQNCVHCKTCDIKDPAQNITWVAPEGGGGPNYPNM